ncbi:siroheme synthase [Schizosaccharomyces japonicus yFS275]|uniref:precorrin-2 dehydrogenase n=1 Tax=Schizosaccharomyces japonicus (strain yFS275 / FY16936) TaxID=402676 RepID=B6JYW5_SCHJY|nr:siroheme synthase [Schizosaccharomyces japonicus yFS275]EEB06733.1 siroheme synthase [Schizosaccharomyces japonicus yFS275]
MSKQEQNFPPITPHGSLILAWQIKDKKVLVVGGGFIAAGRVLHALDADALVTVVCPEKGLNDEVRWRVQNKEVVWKDKTFTDDDLEEDTAMKQTYSRNVADVRQECDFYFGSEVRDGPLQIMVSTNGNGPKLANLIKQRIKASIPDNCGLALQKVGQLRSLLRSKFPDPNLSKKRMRWMKCVSEHWSFDEIASLDEDMMQELVENFPNFVPTFSILTHAEDKQQPMLQNIIWYGTLVAGVLFAASRFLTPRSN